MNIGRYIYKYKIIYGFFTTMPFYPCKRNKLFI